MRGEGGVAGEGSRVVGVPKFLSWDKYTMALMKINSNLPMLPLPCVLTFVILRGSFKLHLRV